MDGTAGRGRQDGIDDDRDENRGNVPDPGNVGNARETPSARSRVTAGAILLGIVVAAGVVGALGVATVTAADAGGTTAGVAGVNSARAGGGATVATSAGVDPRPANELAGATAASTGTAGVAGAGPAATSVHGSFNVILLTQRSTAVAGQPEPYRLNFSTGGRDLIPHPDPGTPVRVEYTVLVDGQPVKNGSVEMEYLDARDVDFEHTFAEPGPHDLSVNATFTVPNANWSRDSRSLRAIDVRAGDGQTDGGDGTDGGSDGGGLPLPGFGAAAALVALLVVGLAVLARARSGR